MSHKTKKRLLLLTSGGDAPGMNAATRSVVRTTLFYGLEVFACHNGYQGLVEEDVFQMDISSVANTISRGGTIIKTSRSPDFLKKEVRDKCRAFLKAKGIEYLVTIGGDGTFRGAEILESEGGPKSIGIPGTIDNDIAGSEYTIGYDTARNTALDALDKIRDTAASHNRYFLVETMGRNSGFLAAEVALAGGAEFALLPEYPMTIADLANRINTPRRKKQSLMIVVSEAGTPGRSFHIAETLSKITPFSYRVCVLGHVQRGGTPTALDRIAASYMGNLAVEGLLAGKSKMMTIMQNGHYVLADFPKPGTPNRKLDDEWLIRLGNILAT